MSAVDVRVPRAANVPEEVAPDGFQSKIVQRYERSSVGTQALFARVYLEGLATRDFEPVFPELVGETTLSATAVVWLKDPVGTLLQKWHLSAIAIARNPCDAIGNGYSVLRLSWASSTVTEGQPWAR